MMKSKALLIDITKCVGCGACTQACAATNHLPDEEAHELSATHYTVLKDFNDGDVHVRKLLLPSTQNSVIPAPGCWRRLVPIARPRPSVRTSNE